MTSSLYHALDRFLAHAPPFSSPHAAPILFAFVCSWVLPTYRTPLPIYIYIEAPLSLGRIYIYTYIPPHTHPPSLLDRYNSSSLIHLYISTVPATSWLPLPRIDTLFNIFDDTRHCLTHCKELVLSFPSHRQPISSFRPFYSAGPFRSRPARRESTQKGCRRWPCASHLLTPLSRGTTRGKVRVP